MRRQSGFTMTELVIVIAIIAVAAAVAIPSYLSWLPDIRLRSAVRDLRSDLGVAKQRAVQENGQVVVLFNTGTNQYTLFVDNGANPGAGGTPDNWNRDGDEVVLKTVPMPDDVTMYDVSFPGTGAPMGTEGVRFDGRALPNVTGNAFVRMRNTKNNFMAIDMSIVGLITIQRSTDGGGTWQNAE